MRQPLALLIFVALGLWACQRPGQPPLVELTGVASTRLREGDVLELRGRAFPEGRRAEVTLRGEVNRAGEPRTKGFELVLSGRSVSPHAVSVEITRNVERALAGIASPAHATFRGSVEVSFAPRVHGTPPVTGQLPEIELDFVPAEGERALAQARRDEGRRFAEFAGLLFVEGAGALLVDGVMPKSPAERAGVARGDRLEELAGVNLLEISDLVPPPRSKSVELVIQREGIAQKSRLVLDVDGFRAARARDFAAAASLVAACVALCLLLASPLGRALSFLEWRLIESLRARRLVRDPPPGRPQRRPRRRARGVSIGEMVALLCGSALVTALGLGRSIVARELDLPIVLAALLFALSLSVVLFGAPGERGVVARLRRLTAVLGRGVPVAAAVVALVADVGTFGPDDLLSAQGPWPSQWLFFRGPIELGLGVAWLVALIPETALGSSPCEKLTPGPRDDRQRLAPSTFIGQLELVVASGVFALAFLGGSRLTANAGAPAAFSLTLFGALLLLIKTGAVAALVLAFRTLLGRIDVTEAGALLWRGAVPASVILVAARLLAHRFSVVVAPGAERAVSWACLAVCVALAVSLARRVVVAVRNRAAEPGLNPWI
ncbi:MAG TPA: PDZ domain-containing protein [Polyangiaceae bacterium]